ncbi:glutathione S-transferase U17-like [Daucus carota subsp. sativus]|uniref:glutathione S-transferase U17-like n=1 Tax=Daucus carota subsp. sativus TaxID=79200 RepID=UPI0030836FF5
MIVLLRDSGLRILMTRWFQSRERKGGVDRAASGRIGAEEAFETCSKRKSYFGGDNIGYTDIAVGSFIGWIKAIEKMSGIKVLAEAKTPGLVGWVTKFLSTDAAKKFVPEPEVYVELLKKMQA